MHLYIILNCINVVNNLWHLRPLVKLITIINVNMFFLLLIIFINICLGSHENY